ncbi:NAD(P)-binding protein [Mollisia scopiformis]|uniref:NAD(P)-binding protein n=1 Tax=Mollisia scopiformis TaxID=149040 RepID=A0A132B4C4_MOLSC|nr:NAD(P)-binding protein [Mollisia scopiformis]KUJ06517.1 NAD(P)-binding protein [Mollisia scopiformis]
MASKKIIVVVGATGKQGSSVAHTFLKLPEWHVRCLTRNPSSSASQALSALGAEVVQGDLSDVSSLSQAFSNANTIFLNTDFWENFVAAGKAPQQGISSDKAAFQKEILYGKNAVQAASAVPSLDRIIYSAIPGVTKGSGGKYSVHHADSKGTIVEYILDDSNLAKKASFIYLGAYTTNALLAPRFIGENYAFVLPFSKSDTFPIIDPEHSTGPFVCALLDEDVGTNLLAYDSYLSFGEVQDLWSKASGEDAGYMQATVEMFRAQGVSEEMLNALEAMKEFGYMGELNFIEPSQLKSKVQTKSFEQWLKGRDWEEVAMPTLNTGRTIR